MRRVLKWVGIALGGLVGLLVLAVATVLIVLHTDWGREKVRQQAEKAMNDMVQGSVELGRVRGSVLTKFTIDGMVVRDREGNEVVRSGQLLVDYSLRALLHRRFVANAIEIKRPIIYGQLDKK